MPKNHLHHYENRFWEIKEIQIWQDDENAQEKLDEISNDNWKLVSVVSGSNNAYLLYFFQREIF